MQKLFVKQFLNFPLIDVNTNIYIIIFFAIIDHLTLSHLSPWVDILLTLLITLYIQFRSIRIIDLPDNLDIATMILYQYLKVSRLILWGVSTDTFAFCAGVCTILALGPFIRRNEKTKSEIDMITTFTGIVNQIAEINKGGRGKEHRSSDDESSGQHSGTDREQSGQEENENEEKDTDMKQRVRNDMIDD